MGSYRALWIGCIIVLAVTGVAVLTGPVFGTDGAGDAEDSDGPQAEAGLDQTVRQGEVVVLDGGGSVAGEGEIVAYEWTIRHPDNTTITPDCSQCEQTEFHPGQPGTYEVRLTITDDADRRATDVMYVDVSPHEPPASSISGPDRMLANETATFDLEATGGDDPLYSIALYRDGELQRGRVLENERYEQTLTIRSPNRNTTLELLAADEVGHTQSTVHNLTVETVPPYFDVEILNTREVGEDLAVDVQVNNTGGRPDIQEIRLCKFPCLRAQDTQMQMLGPRENVSLTLTWPDWESERGEIAVKVRTDNASDQVRLQQFVPFDLSIQGLPTEMRDGSTTNVTTTVHYESGYSETVTANATYSVSQTHNHSYISIPNQESYERLGVEATATLPNPDETSEGILEAEYEGLTAQERTTILPVCDYNPSSPDCPDSGWNFTGSGNGEFYWQVRNDGGSFPDELEPGQSYVPEKTTPGGETYSMEVAIWDYVNRTGGRSTRTAEAAPDADYTSKSETKPTGGPNDVRLRAPELDENLWVWEPSNNRFDGKPYNVAEEFAGDWGLLWDKGATVNSPGYVSVDMQNGVINRLEGGSRTGETRVCLEFDPYVLDPRYDTPRTSCKSLEIVEDDDGGGGDPRS